MKVCEVIISIGPATTKMTADMFDDLKEAVEFAQYNLFVRHKIKLCSFIWFDEYTTIITLEDNKEILTEQNVGRHLRGISSYLLKKYPEKYNSLKDGNRLLYYDFNELHLGGIIKEMYEREE